MTGRFIVIVSSLLFLMTTVPALAHTDPAPQDDVVATIVEVEGTVSITPAATSGDTKSVPVVVGRRVHLNDVLETGPESRAFIRFIDKTELTLAENTNIRVDNYVFNPEDNRKNKAAYSVILGAFQYVSGLIGKKNHPDVRINTPVGSIGIRGTDFWAGKMVNEYGVGVYSVAVKEGQVAVKTDGGEVVVNKGQGTSVQNRHFKPTRPRTWSNEDFERVAATVRLHGAFPKGGKAVPGTGDSSPHGASGNTGARSPDTGNGGNSPSPSSSPSSRPVPNPSPSPVPNPVPNPGPNRNAAPSPDGSSGTEKNNENQDNDAADRQMEKEIRAYQRQLGLPEDGKPPTPEQLEELKKLLEQATPPAEDQ